MAKQVLLSATVLINSVDRSDHVQSVNVSLERDTVEVTSMGDTAKEYVLALADATVEITFFNDFAAGNLDSALFALNQTNTPFPVEVRPNAGARSTSNPGYTMTALLPNYQPVNGSVSDAATTTCTFINASQTGMARNTA